MAKTVTQKEAAKSVGRKLLAKDLEPSKKMTNKQWDAYYDSTTAARNKEKKALSEKAASMSAKADSARIAQFKAKMPKTFADRLMAGSPGNREPLPRDRPASGRSPWPGTATRKEYGMYKPGGPPVKPKKGK